MIERYLTMELPMLKSRTSKEIFAISLTFLTLTILMSVGFYLDLHFGLTEKMMKGYFTRFEIVSGFVVALFCSCLCFWISDRAFRRILNTKT